MVVTIKATQADGKPVILVHENEHQAMTQVMTLMQAEHIAEVQVLIRRDLPGTQQSVTPSHGG